MKLPDGFEMIERGYYENRGNKISIVRELWGWQVYDWSERSVKQEGVFKTLKLALKAAKKIK